MAIFHLTVSNRCAETAEQGLTLARPCTGGFACSHFKAKHLQGFSSSHFKVFMIPSTYSTASVQDMSTWKTSRPLGWSLIRMMMLFCHKKALQRGEKAPLPKTALSWTGNTGQQPPPWTWCLTGFWFHFWFDFYLLVSNLNKKQCIRKENNPWAVRVHFLHSPLKAEDETEMQKQVSHSTQNITI